MNYNSVLKAQKELGYSEMQTLINTGMVWQMEGHAGRQAMDLLRSGACMLPTKRNKDYYGSTIPSRYDVAKGTTGSFQNSVQFYSNEDNLLNW